jgi:2,4-dienoyl-CoA reductase-like NADH-dependent reductase (Old Yellow Enzyme family)
MRLTNGSLPPESTVRASKGQALQLAHDLDFLSIQGKKMNTKLWQPIQVGNIKLNHRFAMARMTRGRSAAHGVPTDLNSEYYAQLASMAPIISEGTQPSDDGQGYLFTPGTYTDDQVIGWRKVTDAVPQRRRLMFIQLMHVGRISSGTKCAYAQKVGLGNSAQ